MPSSAYRQALIELVASLPAAPFARKPTHDTRAACTTGVRQRLRH